MEYISLLIKCYIIPFILVYFSSYFIHYDTGTLIGLMLLPTLVMFLVLGTKEFGLDETE